jgi:O-antigen/teichoic acid export membrane protein
LSLGYVGLLLQLATSLALTPILLRELGQTTWGFWLVAQQLLGYVGLMDLGVLGLLPREVPVAIAQGGLPRLLGKTVRLMFIQLPLIACASAVAWWLAPAPDPTFRPALAVLLLAFTTLAPMRLFALLLEGLQDLGFLGVAQLSGWAVGTAISAAGVLSGFGLMALAVGWASTQFVTAALCTGRLWRRHAGVLPRKLERVPLGEAWAYVKKGLWLTAARSAQPLIHGTDLLVLGQARGAAAVVPYNCTDKLVTVFGNQPSMVLQTAGPGMSELRARGEHQRLAHVRLALTQAVLLLAGGLGCVVLACNPGFVSWWIGAEQFGGMTLTALLVAKMMLRQWNVSLGYAVFFVGYERRLTFMSLADGALTVGATMGLVRWLGPLGAPLGSLLGVCLVSLPVLLVTLAREERRPVHALLTPLWPVAWRLVIACGLAAAVGRWLPPHGFFQLVAWGAVGSLAYLAWMFPVMTREPLSGYMVPRWEALAARIQRLLPAGLRPSGG